MHFRRGVVANLESPHHQLFCRDCGTAEEAWRGGHDVQANLLIREVERVAECHELDWHSEILALRMALGLTHSEHQLVVHDSRQVAEASQRDDSCAEGLQPITARSQPHCESSSGFEGYLSRFLELLLLGEIGTDAASEGLPLMLVIQKPPSLLHGHLLALSESALHAASLTRSPLALAAAWSHGARALPAALRISACACRLRRVLEGLWIKIHHSCAVTPSTVSSINGCLIDFRRSIIRVTCFLAERVHPCGCVQQVTNLSALDKRIVSWIFLDLGTERRSYACAIVQDNLHDLGFLDFHFTEINDRHTSGSSASTDVIRSTRITRPFARLTRNVQYLRRKLPGWHNGIVDLTTVDNRRDPQLEWLKDLINEEVARQDSVPFVILSCWHSSYVRFDLAARRYNSLGRINLALKASLHLQRHIPLEASPHV
mmetsp:Transcript_89791/g.159655  ORF Transcript_89791/g.159655 Transcript_89791/m.159655 type:complete len:431 (+) Transcript_89791:2141-3433(+)